MAEVAADGEAPRTAREEAAVRAEAGDEAGAEAAQRPGEEAEDEGGELCTICLEAVAETEAAELDACSHLFHMDCVVPWVRRSSACPMCRAEVRRVSQRGTGATVVVPHKKLKHSDYAHDVAPDPEAEAIETAVCYVCNEGTRDSDLLLCDGPGAAGQSRCNRACHFDCCGLVSVPRSSWFCDSCQPQQSLAQVTEVAERIAEHGMERGPGDSMAWNTAMGPINAVQRRRRGHRPAGRSGAPLVMHDPHELGSAPPRLVAHSPVNLASMMRDKLRLDQLKGHGVLENRAGFLPTVVRHVTKWRTEPGFVEAVVGSGLLAAMSAWLSPRGPLETTQEAKRIRFAILQQLRHIAPALSFGDAKRSHLGIGIMRCFRDADEAEENKALEQEIIAAFQKLVQRPTSTPAHEAAAVEALRRRTAEHGLRAAPASCTASSSSSSSSSTTSAGAPPGRRTRLHLPGTMRTVKPERVGREAVREVLRAAASSSDPSPGTKRPRPPERMPVEIESRPSGEPLSRAERTKIVERAMYKLLRERIPASDQEQVRSVPKDKWGALMKAAMRKFVKDYRPAFDDARDSARVVQSRTQDAQEVVCKLFGMDAQDTGVALDGLLLFASFGLT